MMDIVDQLRAIAAEPQNVPHATISSACNTAIVHIMGLRLAAAKVVSRHDAGLLAEAKHDSLAIEELRKEING